MLDPFERVISPSDCALLVAVPLTAEEFETDVLMAVDSDPSIARGDFAFGMTRTIGARNAWAEIGNRIAELCSGLIDDAQRVGVRHVSARATLEGFEEAFASGATVVLMVAHWREPDVVMTSDLRNGTREFLVRLLEDSSDEFCVRLLEHRPTRSYTDAQDLRFARDWLSGFLRLVDEPELEAARDELDRRLAGYLVPGNCLELRDGYQKVTTLVDRIPSEWAGIIDLGVCHSLRLAQALKNGRADRAILTNEHARFPERCIPEMRETLLRLSVEPCKYLEKRSTVFNLYNALTG